jgi:hypothetical protein
MAKRTLAPASDPPAIQDQAIGKFFRHFSDLEFALRITVENALEPKGSDAIMDILGLLDYGVLCSATERALLSRDPSERADDKVIKKVIDDCRDMGHKRNRVAHTTWSPMVRFWFELYRSEISQGARGL